MRKSKMLFAFYIAIQIKIKLWGEIKWKNFFMHLKSQNLDM